MEEVEQKLKDLSISRKQNIDKPSHDFVEMEFITHVTDLKEGDTPYTHLLPFPAYDSTYDGEKLIGKKCGIFFTSPYQTYTNIMNSSIYPLNGESKTNYIRFKIQTETFLKNKTISKSHEVKGQQLRYLIQDNDEKLIVDKNCEFLELVNDKLHVKKWAKGKEMVVFFYETSQPLDATHFDSDTVSWNKLPKDNSLNEKKKYESEPILNFILSMLSQQPLYMTAFQKRIVEFENYFKMLKKQKETLEKEVKEVHAVKLFESIRITKKEISELQSLKAFFDRELK